ncbi:MAG: cupredoxin domain-containing protein [Thermoanaerobaculia bacterium]
MILTLRMRLQPFGLLLLAAVPFTPVPSGSVSGQVVLVSSGAQRGDASNAVVWIEGARRPGVASGRPQMRSYQKKFAPRVMAVPKSAPVDFPNVDPIYHNVFSVSGSNRFDLGLYRSGASKSKQFDEVGLVRVYCNIHPQMVGFVMVQDSDFAAVAGPDGKFRFEGVPAGAWTLKAWHEEAAAEAATAVTVRPGAEAAAALRLDVSGYKPQSHKNKYGKDYPPQSASDDERY